MWLNIINFILMLFLLYMIRRQGKRDELSKISDIIDKYELNIIRYFEKEKNIISHDGVTFSQIPKETIQGVGYAVQQIKKKIEEEKYELSHEVRNFFKKIFKKFKK